MASSSSADAGVSASVAAMSIHSSAHTSTSEFGTSPSRTNSGGVPLANRDSFPSFNTAHGTGSNVLKYCVLAVFVDAGKPMLTIQLQSTSKQNISLCHDDEGTYHGVRPVPRQQLSSALPTPELASPTSSGATTPPAPLSPPALVPSSSTASAATIIPGARAVPQQDGGVKAHELDASLRVAQDAPGRLGQVAPGLTTGRAANEPAGVQTRPLRTPSSASTQPELSPGSSRSSSFTGALPQVGATTPVTTLPPPAASVSPGSSPKPPTQPIRKTSGSDAGRQLSGSSATTTKPTRPGAAPSTERKSMFGKFFQADHGHGSRSGGQTPSAAHSGDESGAESETSGTSSAGGALRNFGRRLSASTAGAKLDRNPASAHDVSGLSRQPSQKESKLERKASQKGHDGASEGGSEKHGLAASLKELVGAGPKMSRKPSVTSRKSDDGRSDKGSTHGDDFPSKAGGSVAGGDKSGSLLKKYGVCEKVAIGKGATAVVRLAHKWDRTTERLYAVKEFRKRRKNETEREYVKKLTSEFCISSTLHHAYVVETVDLVQDENSHWCEVMEYCPGGDLYAAIKRGQMSQAEINSYFKQIVLGVAYLHSMGVAHRDIKPENLLIDAQGMVKITDFGVSDVFRMCWEKTTHLSKGLCGSEPYIAPEQFEQKEYDARLVDVWAVAIVFYCLNQQELPWRSARSTDESYQAFVHAYASSPSPPPLQALSPRECRAVVKRMLDPSTKTRSNCDGVVKDPWFQSIQIIDKDGKEVATPPLGPTVGPGMASASQSVSSLMPSHANKAPRSTGENVRSPSTERPAGGAGTPVVPLSPMPPSAARTASPSQPPPPPAA